MSLEWAKDENHDSKIILLISTHFLSLSSNTTHSDLEGPGLRSAPECFRCSSFYLEHLLSSLLIVFPLINYKCGEQKTLLSDCAGPYSFTALRRNQMGQHLDFGLVASRMWDNTFLSFLAMQLVVMYYGSHGKQIYL